MSAIRHISQIQFKGHAKPAQEEGRAASEWLTTHEGHEWYNDRASSAGAHSYFANIKDDEDARERNVASATWPSPNALWDIENNWQG